MQSRPTPNQTDPHAVLAIETLLAAHADKPPVHDAAGRPAEPQATAVPPPLRAPEITVVAPTAEATHRAADAGDIQVENTRPGDIAPLADRPAPRWMKPAVMALLGLCGAIAAAGWQHYGDQAKAMAAGWTPPFVLAALSDKPAAGQDGAPARQAAATDQPAAQPPVPAQPQPAVAAVAAAPSAEQAQLQSMTRDLAAMGQQLEELKAGMAQLRASQAQIAREVAKTSENKASENKAAEARAEARPSEPNPRPRVTATAPPPPRPAAAPVRTPRPAYPPAQTAYVPPPPVPAQPAPPPQPALADDGAPVVRPPMPLR
jgi:hypothetical protein